MNNIWGVKNFVPELDEANCLLTSPLPTCPFCNEIARPNILMFGDWKWIDDRMQQQRSRLDEWLGRVKRVLTIEIGAGSHISTVRQMSEFQIGPLIRINPTNPTAPRDKDVNLKMGGLEALSGIWEAMR